jgi:succinate dehydrogenase hydrophobic anchor subunit
VEQKKNDIRQRWKAPQIVIFTGVAIVVLALVFLIACPILQHAHYQSMTSLTYRHRSECCRLAAAATTTVEMWLNRRTVYGS